MKSKRIGKILSVIVMTTILATGVQGMSMGVKNITGMPSIAYAETATTGLQTPTGIVSKLISYTDVISEWEKSGSGSKDLNTLISKSTKIDPVNNPEYFGKHMTTGGTGFAKDRINLTSKPLYWRDNSKFGVEDGFIQVYKMEAGTKEGMVKKYFSIADYLDGNYAGSTSYVEEYTDVAAYNYLINEGKDSTKPTEPEKPVEPSKPTEPSKPEVINYLTKRLEGYDRYETTTQIANEVAVGQVNSLVLTSGLDFPDALSGSVLATKNAAPIILANGYDRDSFAINYAKNHLSPGGKIYVLGGTSAVTDLTLAKFKAEGLNNIERIGGINRYETNMLIANKMNVPAGTPIIIGNADGFADNLSISGIAGSKGYPIVLTDGMSLTQEAKDYIAKIHPSNIYIVGGTAVIGNSVESQLKNYGSVERLAGLNRYETSLAIAKKFSNGSQSAMIATGLDFPDALAGSALAGKLCAPILLVNKYESVSEQKAWLDSSSVRNLYFLGGSDVVTDSQASTLSKSK